MIRGLIICARWKNHAIIIVIRDGPSSGSKPRFPRAGWCVQCAIQAAQARGETRHNGLSEMFIATFLEAIHGHGAQTMGLPGGTTQPVRDIMCLASDESVLTRPNESWI